MNACDPSTETSYTLTPESTLVGVPPDRGIRSSALLVETYTWVSSTARSFRLDGSATCVLVQFALDTMDRRGAVASPTTTYCDDSAMGPSGSEPYCDFVYWLVSSAVYWCSRASRAFHDPAAGALSPLPGSLASAYGRPERAAVRL